MINLSQIEERRFYRPNPRPLKEVKSLVLHWPAGDYIPDIGKLWSWMNSESNNSYHFLISETTIYQCMPLSFRSVHCGHKSYKDEAVRVFGKRACSNLDSPNNWSVSACILHDRPDGSYSSATLETAVELSSAICNKFALDPIKQIGRHSDYTDEKKINCPLGFYLDDGELFGDFKKWVNEDIIYSRDIRRRGL